MEAKKLGSKMAWNQADLDARELENKRTGNKETWKLGQLGSMMAWDTSELERKGTWKQENLKSSELENKRTC